MEESIPMYIRREEAPTGIQHPYNPTDPLEEPPDQTFNISSLYSIKILFQAIEADNHTLIENVMRSLPIDTIGTEAQDMLMKQLVTECRGYDDREDIMNEVLNQWSRIYPRDQRVPLELEVCKNRFFTEDDIIYVLVASGFTDFVECIDGLSEGSDSNINDPFVGKLVSVFDPSAEMLEEAIKRAAALENRMIERYLRPKLSEKQSYVPIPNWVKNYMYDEGEDGDIPTEYQLVELLEGELYSREPDRSNTLEMIDETIEMMKHNSIEIFDVEDATHTIEMRARVADAVDYQEIFFGYYPDPIDDEKNEWYVRIYGPNNPVTITDEEAEERWMFSDEDVDEVGDLSYWFTGSCSRCLGKIREYWHAIREPQEGGGWEGCYCSWRCLRLSLDGDVDKVLMVDAFEGQMVRLGVQDRKGDDIISH